MVWTLSRTQFPAAPLDLLLCVEIFWVGGMLFDKCSTSITTSHKSRAVITTCGCASSPRCSRLSAQDVVQCVVNRLLSCPGCVWFCGWGAPLGAARKGSTPPTPEGRHPPSCLSSHFLPPFRAPMQKRSWAIRPILFAFRGSRRLWVVRPSTRVSCLSQPTVGRPPMVSLRLFTQRVNVE